MKASSQNKSTWSANRCEQTKNTILRYGATSDAPDDTRDGDDNESDD